jgi:tetrahydrodipicolinate N-succinyltransferase
MRVLRFPSVVLRLGVMRTEMDQIDAIRRCYENLNFKLHHDAVFENWEPECFEVGESVSIEKGTILSWSSSEATRGVVSLGSGTWIGQYNNFRLSGGTFIKLGSGCHVSQFCSLIATNHGIRRNARIADQPHDMKKHGITLGDDVWLGSGVTVLPGVSIGDGAVIGAGAVVTCDVGAYEIWGGVPASKISERVE